MVDIKPETLHFTIIKNGCELSLNAVNINDNYIKSIIDVTYTDKVTGLTEFKRHIIKKELIK